ncbi:ribonuclease H, partial [Trifolium pratense]
SCLYKLVSKVLAARLAKVIGSLIRNTQSAFIKERNLVEVDFEKAYDFVDWGFLDFIIQRFGFCNKWHGWMRTCVCSGNISVLVNGSPTEEININRGLKKGDSLAPHLFLLVAEGLGALMRKAVDIARFKPFCVGSVEFPVSILQYADDTLCIGEPTVENLWTLKAVLRGFELASGLKVNFWKSGIIRVNVLNDLLMIAANFLNCRIGNLPFKYLGLPVGANPKLMTTWQPMLDIIRGRVGSWGNKYLSFGGRIVMVNAVLNVIPIFYLSYLKIPGKVWREVVKIQRKFLWSGLSNKNKISWVKWDDVCRPKKDGGLGVRDLKLTNLSLLAKWRWKLLQPEGGYWRDIVIAKYGKDVVGRHILHDDRSVRSGSSWWRNICLLENNSDWFELGVEKVLGNGNTTSFWNDVWVGTQSLAIAFPRLFSISVQQHFTINRMGARVDDDHSDGWRWKADPQMGFTAKSAYHSLIRLQRSRNGFDQLLLYVFKNLWKTAAPCKVVAFSWQLLLDRIPTIANPSLRGVANGGNSNCSLCNAASIKSTVHLFLQCEFAAKVWYHISLWIGQVFILPPNMHLSFSMMLGCGMGKTGKKELLLIWHATIWTVWRIRNNRILIMALLMSMMRWRQLKGYLGNGISNVWQKSPASSMNGG